jgi:hypothetical protein
MSQTNRFYKEGRFPNRPRFLTAGCEPRLPGGFL